MERWLDEKLLYQESMQGKLVHLKVNLIYRNFMSNCAIRKSEEIEIEWYNRQLLPSMVVQYTRSIDHELPLSDMCHDIIVWSSCTHQTYIVTDVQGIYINTIKYIYQHNSDYIVVRM